MMDPAAFSERSYAILFSGSHASRLPQRGSLGGQNRCGQTTGKTFGRWGGTSPSSRRGVIETVGLTFSEALGIATVAQLPWPRKRGFS